MDKVFVTIFCGVSVYVLGQIILRLFIEPIAELRKTISQVQYNLIYSAHILHNSEVMDIEKINEVSLALRSLCAELHAKRAGIPLYPYLSWLVGLPSESKIRKGATNLIALSNWINLKEHPKKLGHILKNSQELYENLSLKIDKSDRLNEETIKALI